MLVLSNSLYDTVEFWLKKHFRSIAVIVVRFTLKYNGSSWHVTVYHRHAHFCIWSLRNQDCHWQHKNVLVSRWDWKWRKVGWSKHLSIRAQWRRLQVRAPWSFRVSDCSLLCSWKKNSEALVHTSCCVLWVGSILSRIQTCVCLSLEFSFCIMSGLIVYYWYKLEPHFSSSGRRRHRMFSGSHFLKNFPNSSRYLIFLINADEFYRDHCYF